jgi:ATP synthase protein I
MGKQESPWKAALIVASVGIEMAAAILIGYLIGSYLDRLLGTEPWLFYIFLIIGVLAGFKGLWRTAKRYWPQ